MPLVALAVEDIHDPADTQPVVLLGVDVHLPHTEEVPTDTVAEVANELLEAVVLEVANHLGAQAFP